MKWRVVLVDGVAMFALDARGYESLSRNLAEATRWMHEASWQLGFYLQTRTPPGAK